MYNIKFFKLNSSFDSLHKKRKISLASSATDGDLFIITVIYESPSSLITGEQASTFHQNTSTSSELIRYYRK